MTILYSLMLLAVGGALLLLGFRLARFIIPMWGFLAGLSVGGSVISAMDGTPFLGSVLGVVVGLVLGLLFAVFAYMYYAVAIIVLIGAVGYWAGANFILLLGFNPGLLSFLAGLFTGIIVGMIALALNAPKYTLVLFTAAAGAMTVVGGIMLLLNKLELDSFSYSAVNTTLSDSFLWSLGALALLLVGVVVQARTTGNYAFETWALDSDHNKTSTPPTTTPTPTAGSVS